MMGDYLDHNKPMGANVKRLLAIHATNITARRYGKGLAGSIEGVKNLASVSREAMAEVEGMIRVVKSEPDNPYGDDDEAIAREILKFQNEFGHLYHYRDGQFIPVPPKPVPSENPPCSIPDPSPREIVNWSLSDTAKWFMVGWVMGVIAWLLQGR